MQVWDTFKALNGSFEPKIDADTVYYLKMVDNSSTSLAENTIPSSARPRFLKTCLSLLLLPCLASHALSKEPPLGSLHPYDLADAFAYAASVVQPRQCRQSLGSHENNRAPLFVPSSCLLCLTLPRLPRLPSPPQLHLLIAPCDLPIHTPALLQNNNITTSSLPRLSFVLLNSSDAR